MDDIILLGAGGHARSCIDVIESENKFFIYGLVENHASQNQGILGYRVIGTDNHLKNIYEKVDFALVAIGQIKSPAIRIKLYDTLTSIGFILPIISSPSAYISKHSNINEGTIIMHNAVINASAYIGKNCIINNFALVEHNAIIGDHCHLATNVTVNGDVVIGQGTFLGSGAIVSNGITIGSNCVIGAGVVVKKHLDDNQVMLK